MPFSLLRRTLVQRLAMAGGIAAVWPARHSKAAGLPHLDVKDPAAAALGYVEEASQVDVKKYPAFVQSSNCENCLQLEGKAGEAYRPCSLFPGKAVHSSGWCSGWTAEM